ncbi:MAG: ribose-5-phosphate isomerase RpiA [Candidatus Burarchaeum sp.]|nr:ribose-5-phosphate isomerase RpiA [Candidatus Burarchaeum sp.]MDO8340287.1 ribose-5-phosphate isomerase RpiA [Candidatus Burarchaeum sp.]
MANTSELAKHNAALAALPYIRPGMTVGLGTGSTANIFVDLLAARERREHLGLKCIATSENSEKQAARAGLRLVSFADAPMIDVVVDGADIVSADFCLLKGLGGALLREKCVAYRSKKFIVLVGEEKLRRKLEGIVPIEVLPFAAPAVLREISKLSKRAKLRTAAAGRPFITDNGNYIIDAPMRVSNPAKLEAELKYLPGVLETGIFTRADIVLVGNKTGCRTLKNKKQARPLLLTCSCLAKQLDCF